MLRIACDEIVRTNAQSGRDLYRVLEVLETEGQRAVHVLATDCGDIDNGEQIADSGECDVAGPRALHEIAAQYDVEQDVRVEQDAHRARSFTQTSGSSASGGHGSAEPVLRGEMCVVVGRRTDADSDAAESSHHGRESLCVAIERQGAQEVANELRDADLVACALHLCAREHVGIQRDVHRPLGCARLEWWATRVTLLADCDESSMRIDIINICALIDSPNRARAAA